MRVVRTDLSMIIDALIEHYHRSLGYDFLIPLKARDQALTPLEVLIGVVLSQNSTDRNAWRALESLLRHYGGRVTIERLRETDVNTIEDLIRPAGMYRLKARTIKNIALRLREEDELVRLDPDALREVLLSIRGVGPKTVDVFLASVRNFPTFPIDTHIRRILYRLGVVERASEKYERIKAEVMRQLTPNKLLIAHYVLILHGRRVCRARNPRCALCPVRDTCVRNGLS
ncbi:MAG: endonuclease III [Zestosphaera sp.]